MATEENAALDYSTMVAATEKPAPPSETQEVTANVGAVGNEGSVSRPATSTALQSRSPSASGPKKWGATTNEHLVKEAQKLWEFNNELRSSKTIAAIEGNADKGRIKANLDSLTDAANAARSSSSRGKFETGPSSRGPSRGAMLNALDDIDMLEAQSRSLARDIAGPSSRGSESAFVKHHDPLFLEEQTRSDDRRFHGEAHPLGRTSPSSRGSDRAKRSLKPDADVSPEACLHEPGGKIGMLGLKKIPCEQERHQHQYHENAPRRRWNGSEQHEQHEQPEHQQQPGATPKRDTRSPLPPPPPQSTQYSLPHHQQSTSTGVGSGSLGASRSSSEPRFKFAGGTGKRSHDPGKVYSEDGTFRLRGVASLSDVHKYTGGVKAHTKKSWEVREAYKLMRAEQHSQVAMQTWAALKQWTASNQPFDKWQQSTPKARTTKKLARTTEWAS